MACLLQYVDLGRATRTASASDRADLQIVVEALCALIIFLPGIALYTEKLHDVTYRGELSKR